MEDLFETIVLAVAVLFGLALYFASLAGLVLFILIGLFLLFDWLI